MSGLAAGIRLAHFGKKVCICEQHFREGGLNSYFDRHHFRLETGLHAMTNFVSRDASKAMPLLKLLRQLRIPYDALKLREQVGSQIVFAGHRLEFDNDYQTLHEAVKREFPDRLAGFEQLNRLICDYDINRVDDYGRTARQVIAEHFKDPQLTDMILTPIMFYGSPSENDLDFYSFVVLYKSIFHEGFCRPAETGIRHLLGLLKERFVEAGGELLMNCRVERLVSRNGHLYGVECQGGRVLETANVLSSAGSVETFALCTELPPPEMQPPPGSLAYFEALVIPGEEFDFRTDRTVIFYNRSSRLNYREPQDLCDFNSALICFPRHFHFLEDDIKPPPMVRVSVLANSRAWHLLGAGEYATAKQETLDRLLVLAEETVGFRGLGDNMIFTDTFSPRTVSRFTGRVNGAIYGSPVKFRDGRTHLDNLYLCGTDQGFLGITGAMMSGITIANRYLLA